MRGRTFDATVVQSAQPPLTQQGSGSSGWRQAREGFSGESEVVTRNALEMGCKPELEKRR